MRCASARRSISREAARPGRRSCAPEVAQSVLQRLRRLLCVKCCPGHDAQFARRDFDLGRAEARSPEAWQYRRLRLPPRLDAQPTGPFFRIVREVDPDPRKADSALGARLQRGQRLDGAADFVREPPRCGGGIIEPRCHVPARVDEFEGGFLRPENAAQIAIERIALFFAQTAGTADRRLQRLAQCTQGRRPRLKALRSAQVAIGGDQSTRGLLGQTQLLSDPIQRPGVVAG